MSLVLRKEDVADLGPRGSRLSADFSCFPGRRKETLKERFCFFGNGIVVGGAMFFDGSVSGATRHFTRADICRHNPAFASLTRAGVTYGE